VGRDILSRILCGTLITLKIGLISVLLGLTLGTVIGTIGGYYGGKTDAVVVFFTDVLFSFPGMFLAIAIVAAVGVSLGAVIIAAGASSIPQFIRITRGVVMAEKERDYVLAARAMPIHFPYDPLERRDRTIELLKKVGLSEDHYSRYLHELSGG